MKLGFPLKIKAISCDYFSFRENRFLPCKGSALISALLIVALVGILVITLIERQQIDIRRTQQTLDSQQAYLYALGVEAWAIKMLKDDNASQQKKLTQTSWPKITLRQTIPEGTVSGTIQDEQGKYNLYNLTNPVYRNQFSRLLHIVIPDLSSETISQVTNAVTEWISTMQHQNTASELAYRQLSPPYAIAHRPFVSVSELRLVKYITPQIFVKLEPYLTALPQTTTINVNAASAPVIASLSDGIALANAQAIVADREGRHGFKSSDEFLRHPALKLRNISANQITVTSEYFLVRSDVVLHDQPFTLLTLLKRYTEGNKPQVAILWQSRETL